MKKSPETQTLNVLCRKCLRSCKQTIGSMLVDCPRYYPLPFKVEQPRYTQMDLFGKNEKP